MDITVEDAMTKNVITAGKNEKIINIAKKMKNNDIGSMIITENDKLLGLITSEDLIKRVIIQKKDSNNTTAEEIMTKNLLTASPDEELSDVIETMISNKIKRLPVVDDGKLVGILTDGDIMRISPQLMENFLNNKEESDTTEGVCELCGNYSNNLSKVNERWICEDCLENSSNI